MTVNGYLFIEGKRVRVTVTTFASGRRIDKRDFGANGLHLAAEQAAIDITPTLAKAIVKGLAVYL